VNIPAAKNVLPARYAFTGRFPVFFNKRLAIALSFLYKTFFGYPQKGTPVETGVEPKLTAI